MTVLLQLFTAFFTIGLFSFGGGYVIISFLQQEVERRGWMTAEQFVDFLAIAQSTPGPIAINMATFVGFEAGGPIGAVVATVAVALPGMILMTLVALFFFRLYQRPGVQAVFQGLRPVVVGLIAAVTWQIGRIALINWTAVAISLISILLIAKWKIHPALLVLAAAIAGILLF